MDSAWSWFDPGDASGQANTILRIFCAKSALFTSQEIEKKLVVPADVARRHVSRAVKQDMENPSLRTTSHRPDSLDATLGDFSLFGYVKRALQESEFQSVENLLEAIVRMSKTIPTDILIGRS
jgi:hypothetical protein